jgi:thiaminase/transcriptional activator TenA
MPTMTSPTTSEQLWQDHADLANDCLLHPFVQGIGNGSLAQSAFAYYVGQDAFFLEAFARAYSIAAAKCPDWKGFRRFHRLASGVLQELELHESYAEQWGVDLSNVMPSVATRRYTDFLLAIAWGQEIGVTTAAMLPCMRLYRFLGEQLAQGGLPDHSYRDWIETYSSPEFQSLTEELSGLADLYSQAGSNTVASAYRYAMQCELDFFEAAWRMG